jgi:ribose transport system permease protein
MPQSKLLKTNQGFTSINSIQIISLLIFLIFISIIFTILSPHFLTFSNIINVIRQIAVISLIAFGMNFVILLGGIDLSVGSIVAATGIVAAVVNLSTHSLLLTILMVVFSGIIIGIINGIVIVSFKIPDFIATLGMMSVIRGIVMVVTKANPIYGMSQSFYFLGQGYIGPIPFPVILSFLIFAIALIILKYNKFGRYIYATGSNQEVARLSGINVKLVRIIIYGISGLTAGISGLLLASRTAAAVPIAGVGYELDAIAAVVLGGTSLVGGRGSLVGTLLGLMVLGVLANGLVLLGINPFYIDIVKGAILLVAVAVTSRK